MSFGFSINSDVPYRYRQKTDVSVYFQVNLGGVHFTCESKMDQVVDQRQEMDIKTLHRG